jgi:hypothetical protein
MENLNVDERILLKQILGNKDMRVRTGFNWSECYLGQSFVNKLMEYRVTQKHKYF